MNHDVTKLARALNIATTAAMVALPVVFLGWGLTTSFAVEAVNGVAVSPDATRAQIIAVVVLGLISPIILLWTLNQMRRLFDAYAKGNVLTEASARLIQKIGQGFLVLAIAPFVLRPVQSVLLSMANPAGERSLAVGLDSDMIFFALAGGLIIIIGWAIRDASAVVAENRSFI